MKITYLLVSAFGCGLFLAGSLSAQIYADIEITQGEELLGTVRAELYYDKSPRICANFIGLATGQRPWIDPVSVRLKENTPFYDGLIFHRLVHGFVLQGGDPTGVGSGGPGYVFQDQFHPELNHDGPYYLSMAHSGPHTNGSQFFITLSDTPELNNFHSIFGKIIQGQEIIDNFNNAASFPVNASSRPLTTLTMQTVTISGPSLADFDPMDPAHGLPTFSQVDLEMLVELNPESDLTVLLTWARRPYVDYPTWASQDLDKWYSLVHLMSMDADDEFKVDVTGVFTAPMNIEREFYQIAAIDYNHLPKIPRSIFQPGTVLKFKTEDGELRVTFTETLGTWEYEITDGITTQGQLTNRRQYLDNSVLPDVGAWGTQQGTYARFLPVRPIDMSFDGPVGPLEITSIFPRMTLSFHSATSGWYNGRVSLQSNTEEPFRNTFEVVWPQ